MTGLRHPVMFAVFVASYAAPVELQRANDRKLARTSIRSETGPQYDRGNDERW